MNTPTRVAARYNRATKKLINVIENGDATQIKAAFHESYKNDEETQLFLSENSELAPEVQKIIYKTNV